MPGSDFPAGYTRPGFTPLLPSTWRRAFVWFHELHACKQFGHYLAKIHQTMLISIECYTFKPLKIKICKLRDLNMQHSMLITLPNLYIASLLAIQNKK